MFSSIIRDVVVESVASHSFCGLPAAGIGRHRLRMQHPAPAACVKCCCRAFPPVAKCILESVLQFHKRGNCRQNYIYIIPTSTVITPLFTE